MSNDPVSSAFEVGTGSVFLGTVVSAEEGSVLVAQVSEPSVCWHCKILQAAAGGSPILSPADLVLVCTTDADHYAVIMGRIGSSHSAQLKPEATVEQVPDELVIEAKKNLTLKCGQGSITIREDGKILIKGKDLVSHAQRMNRIKGGSVSIN